MAIIHAVIQCKSVGKTLVSLMLAHYLMAECGRNVVCLDTDDLNSSLSNFAALQAVQIGITGLADYCRTIPHEIDHAVIDTNSGGFLPFCTSLQEEFLPALTEAGHTLHLHTIVSGGSLALDTFNGFRSLAANFPTIPITIWLNPFWGRVALRNRLFEESKVYQEHIGSIHSLIRLQENSTTYQYTIQQMLSLQLTFREAIQSASIYLMERARLSRIWWRVIEQLNCAVISE